MNERDKELAFQAGFVAYELEDYTEGGYDIRYERFADLIRADEREACAKLCEDKWDMYGSAIPDCIVAIRARGNT